MNPIFEPIMQILRHYINSIVPKATSNSPNSTSTTLSILGPNPKLPTIITLPNPHPPLLSNQPNQSLSNISDLIIRMQTLDMRLHRCRSIWVPSPVSCCQLPAIHITGMCGMGETYFNFPLATSSLASIASTSAANSLFRALIASYFISIMHLMHPSSNLPRKNSQSVSTSSPPPAPLHSPPPQPPQTLHRPLPHQPLVLEPHLQHPELA